MKTSHFGALVLVGGAILSACSSYGPRSAPPAPVSSSTPVAATEYGTIDAIQTTTQASTAPSGTGAVVGGLVGALAGNQVGSGSGRTAATVAGAAGGALLGNQIESNRANAQPAYQINVRLDNGGYRTVVQDSVYDLRVGDRVRVVDGRAYRY